MASISETLTRQLEAFVAAHSPTRVLVGGLPGFILESIAQSWRGTDELLLVSGPVASAETLPARVRRCSPDDLTAARQETWVALVHHSQSRGIQESIRGAGAGTVREV